MPRGGSKLQRTVQYFEEIDLNEARAAFMLVNEVMTKRLGAVAQVPKAVPKKKSKLNSKPRPVENSKDEGDPLVI